MRGAWVGNRQSAVGSRAIGVLGHVDLFSLARLPTADCRLPIPTNRSNPMTEFFRSLRRRRGDHRQVFAEFVLTLMFLKAEMAVKKRRARLRVVG